MGTLPSVVPQYPYDMKAAKNWAVYLFKTGVRFPPPPYVLVAQRGQSACLLSRVP